MATASRPHVLVVDDEPVIHEALTAALADRYTVHAAATGAEACAILRTHPIAAIILDAILHDEHGLDLVDRFRRVSAAPVLLLTGYGSEGLAARAVWVGVKGYLKKPVSVSELQAAVARFVPAPYADLAARARLALDAYPPRPFRGVDLANQLGVEEAYLRRVFRTAYGKTPRRYLAEIRLQRARALLRTTDQGVKGVADAVGFTSALALRRGFRKLLGMPPHASRREPMEPTTAD